MAKGALTNRGEPAASATRRRKSRREQEILDAAIDVFHANGYAATSVDDIAKAAGTSRATFYAHFTDKQDVIREFARSMWETAFTVYKQFSSLDKWTPQTIGGWMENLSLLG